MSNYKSKVCLSKVENTDNCYVLVSVRKKDTGYFSIGCETVVSFLYDSGEYAAEWEPEYGPIMVWHKCEPSDSGAKEHYFYDFVDNTPLNCSYKAVEDTELKQAALDGSFSYIFSVLKDWARG